MNDFYILIEWSTNTDYTPNEVTPTIIDHSIDVTEAKGKLRERLDIVVARWQRHEVRGTVEWISDRYVLVHHPDSIYHLRVGRNFTVGR